jgi:hypothetical protein
MPLVLTVLIKRKPGYDEARFHERWREHGRTIADEPTLARHILRYEQRHKSADDGFGGDVDGVAVQHYASMDEFVAFTQEPKYVELIQPDEEELFDFTNLVLLFTDEPEVFIE